MTRTTETADGGGRVAELPESVSFRPTKENAKLLVDERKLGIPFTFTIQKGLDLLRKHKGKRS